jgi:hypothetical protein
MEQGTFNNKKALLTSKLNLHLRQILIKCYTWSTASCGAGTWALRKVDHKFWIVLKCGAGEVWRRSVGPIVREMKKC